MKANIIIFNSKELENIQYNLFLKNYKWYGDRNKGISEGKFKLVVNENNGVITFPLYITIHPDSFLTWTEVPKKDLRKLKLKKLVCYEE